MFEVAQTQYGLITAEQLVRAGLTHDQIHRRAQRGELVRVRRGVYLVAGAPAAPEQPVLAACLAGGPGLVASYRSAAALHRFDCFVATGVDVTAWDGSHPRLDGVTIHQRAVPDWQRGIARGVPATTAAATYVDLSGTLTDEAMGKSLDDARRLHVVRFADIVRCAEDRRSVDQITRLMDARLHDVSDSDPEGHVLWVLTQAGLPLPVPQYQVGKYTLDYAYPPPCMVYLEYLGFEFHGQNRSGFDKDKRRNNKLRRMGWHLVELTSAFTDDDIVEEVGDALAARSMAAS